MPITGDLFEFIHYKAERWKDKPIVVKFNFTGQET
jgi:hypothetical protein